MIVLNRLSVLPGYDHSKSEVEYPPAATQLSATVLLVLAFLFPVASAQIELPTGPRIYLSMDLLDGGYEIGDGRALHALLQEVGALPDHESRVVIKLQSIDSAWLERDHVTEKARWLAIVDASTQVGAPLPIYVAGPWGTEQNMQQRVAAFGSERSAFPTTQEELEEAGFDWLANPHGFELRWDLDGRVAGQIADRYMIFGVEQIRALNLTLCADRNSILGWAQAYSYREPSKVSLGRFVEDCLNGSLELYTDLSLPGGLLDDYGLIDKPFALLLPRFTYSDLEGAIRVARQSLGASRLDIPLILVATDTLSDDGSRFVPADEHAELLLELGVEVDLELSGALPAWVQSYGTHGVSLLLFDDTGTLLSGFYVGSFAIPDYETLNQALFRLGLF